MTEITQLHILMTDLFGGGKSHPKTQKTHQTPNKRTKPNQTTTKLKEINFSQEPQNNNSFSLHRF